MSFDPKSVSFFEGEIAWRTIKAEAGGEPYVGKLAVACVIVRRAKMGRWGDSLTRVCFAPYQFSCWNTRDQARMLIADAKGTSPVDAECIQALDQALKNSELVAPGATHYLNPVVVKKLSGELPDWANEKNLVEVIGRHHFFKVPNP